jgi:hypothetical protein
LRDDPFAEALDIYLRDLERVAVALRDLSPTFATFNLDCRTFNSEARGFDEEVRSWNQSTCVSGLPEYPESGCASQRGNLSNRRSALEGDYADISSRSRTVTAAFQEISAKARPAIANASAILNPANTEQVLRLFIWHVLDEKNQAPFDSCRSFARIASALGRRAATQRSFIDYLTRNVIEPRFTVSLETILSGSRPAMPATTVSTERFDSSGFKAKFKNRAGQTKNLVRHTAVHLLTGYNLPLGTTPNQLLTYYRDLIHPDVPEYGDYYLALAAGQLGFRLGHGVISTSEFGDAMISQLCD